VLRENSGMLTWWEGDAATLGECRGIPWDEGGTANTYRPCRNGAGHHRQDLLNRSILSPAHQGQSIEATRNASTTARLKSAFQDGFVGRPDNGKVRLNNLHVIAAQTGPRWRLYCLAYVDAEMVGVKWAWADVAAAGKKWKLHATECRANASAG
jgi:hypothetical protein